MRVLKRVPANVYAVTYSLMTVLAHVDTNLLNLQGSSQRRVKVKMWPSVGPPCGFASGNSVSDSKLIVVDLVIKLAVEEIAGYLLYCSKDPKTAQMRGYLGCDTVSCAI